MERLVRIAAMLQAHPEHGVSGKVLEGVAGFAGGADPGTQLKREIRHLENQGWRIENLAPAGENAIYKMTTVDNRFRFRLTPAQQAALRRAVLMAHRADLVQRLGLPEQTWTSDVADLPTVVAASTPADLGLVVDAVRDRQVLRFTYKGVARVVHPDSVRNQNSVWYLRGVEETDLADLVVKAFVVTRMTDVDADAPGSAQVLPAVRHTGLHPMSWEIDPPVEVTFRAPARFEADVRRWLGEPLAVEPVGDDVHLRYRVTNRAALRTRLIELGNRVRIVGPDDVRAVKAAGLPVIGIHKLFAENVPVYITPSIGASDALIDAGLAGFEIVNASPRASDFTRARRDSVIAHPRASWTTWTPGAARSRTPTTWRTTGPRNRRPACRAPPLRGRFHAGRN